VAPLTRRKFEVLPSIMNDKRINFGVTAPLTSRIAQIVIREVDSSVSLGVGGGARDVLTPNANTLLLQHVRHEVYRFKK
jgi:hypothetical protein